MPDELWEIMERERKRGHDARMLLEWGVSKGAVELSEVRPGGLDSIRILDIIWGLDIKRVVVGHCLGGWTFNGFWTVNRWLDVNQILDLVRVVGH